VKTVTYFAPCLIHIVIILLFIHACFSTVIDMYRSLVTYASTKTKTHYHFSFTWPDYFEVLLINWKLQVTSQVKICHRIFFASTNSIVIGDDDMK